MRQLQIAFILTLVLVGCVLPDRRTPAPELRFSHSTATEQQLLKERYECMLETQQRESQALFVGNGGGASSKVTISCSAFNACLAARGYRKSADGNLLVPDSAAINCSD